MEGEAIAFTWNADEVLKLIDRGYRVVMFKDGLGDVTALAIPPGVKLDAGVKRWRDYDGEGGDTIEGIQRDVFSGPNKFSGGGRTASQALHCLAEKAVFGRLPDGRGGYFEPPEREQE